MTVMKKFTKGFRIDYILGIVALVFVGLLCINILERKHVSIAYDTWSIKFRIFRGL